MPESGRLRLWHRSGSEDERLRLGGSPALTGRLQWGLLRGEGGGGRLRGRLDSGRLSLRHRSGSEDERLRLGGSPAMIGRLQWGLPRDEGGGGRLRGRLESGRLSLRHQSGSEDERCAIVSARLVRLESGRFRPESERLRARPEWRRDRPRMADAVLGRHAHVFRRGAGGDSRETFLNRRLWVAGDGLRHFGGLGRRLQECHGHQDERSSGAGLAVVFNPGFPQTGRAIQGRLRQQVEQQGCELRCLLEGRRRLAAGGLHGGRAGEQGREGEVAHARRESSSGTVEEAARFQPLSPARRVQEFVTGAGDDRILAVRRRPLIVLFG